MRRFFLAVLALAGACAILSFVTREVIKKAQPDFRSRVARHREAEFIVATQRLVDFCRSHDLEKIDTDALLGMLRSEGHLWWGLSYVEHQNIDGKLRKGLVLRPDGRETEFALCTLLTIAGKPPSLEAMDLAPAQLTIIDEKYMCRDPMEAMGELSGIR